MCGGGENFGPWILALTPTLGELSAVTILMIVRPGSTTGV